jgi:hypothetical protein
MTSPATDTSVPQARAELVGPDLKAREGEEIWTIQVNGQIFLVVTQQNRHGGLVDADMKLGPNWAGRSFRIKTEDREDNQARCMNPDLDPFLNGMLIRRDADQQANPATASSDALTTEKLIEIFELDLKMFADKVEPLGEVPTRKLIEMGEALDLASLKQMEILKDKVARKYSVGGPQVSLTADQGERLS